MRRLKLYVATSVDGYIARHDGDASWQLRDADYGYEAFFAGIDTVLLGRRAYERALTSDRWPYPQRRVIVFTRNRELAIASPDTAATSRAPRDVVLDLRTRDGKDLWLGGGSELVRTCLDAALIDEVIVSIHPVILGGGISFVATGGTSLPLRLAAERHYPSGLVQLVYRADRG